ncbi:ZrgA family zinc uptake protein [Endozoicomonas euniceicola]|uniref:DUF2987 domain-containing protein n=1 Tax=Endozoicomonas euniceicola TaxID=1234143 RepID=A0ABY6GSJ1_9GAMM|nr:hypothetical protein [Endozoicomonas euniceicola]UYM15727.1 hypothetical protein NX720_23340 [Endozoicomonas euniceicola]
MKRCVSTMLSAVLLIVAAANVQSEIVLHRAVEPAQIIVDVSLKKENLTLFISIPILSVAHLTAQTDYKSLTQQLRQSTSLWETPVKARCSPVNHRLFITSQPDSNDTSAIEGFFDFNCKEPEQLLTITPRLATVLPGLKVINLWVTTDHWQHKKNLVLPDGIIQLTP